MSHYEGYSIATGRFQYVKKLKNSFSPTIDGGLPVYTCAITNNEIKMATVQTNALINGLSGMLGTMVFRRLRGKTIVAQSPQRPQRQSERQKLNRNKFREASAWARTILLDAAKKNYYLKKARQLKLPNAYTAAITDYMRSPEVHASFSYGDQVTYVVQKKNFELKQVEIVDSNDCTVNVTNGKWSLRLNRKKYGDVLPRVRVTDDAGVVRMLNLRE